MLEIRLLENYDVVDVFVIYEAPYTQRGVPKPLYFNETRATGRWDRFQDKILHCVNDDPSLAGTAQQAARLVAAEVVT